MAVARRAAGLSQRAVADILGVSRATVARMESGRAEMSASRVVLFLPPGLHGL
ncbi:MAG: helix-turn-helix transcriptional regulator [Deltaproteobacteria bacterium]|nr:helix-turn-helix transcriptional regulator [Deltaproteobacteria bacterium]